MAKLRQVEFDVAQLGCISACIEAGIPQHIVAKAFGVSPGALEKHAFGEIQDASAFALAKVVSNLYVIATTPDPKCTTAAIFYLKARGKWRDVDSVQDRPPAISVEELTTSELVAEIVRRRARDGASRTNGSGEKPPSVH